MPAITTKSLSKLYHLPNRKTRLAVDSLNINVEPGTAFGFLGPNGAGKTTTIKMLLNFLEPTSGEAEIFGINVNCPESRTNIGYLPEQPYFAKFLKPLEIVQMHAQLAGMSGKEIQTRCMESLEMVGISEYAKTPISKLSKGLTQRVGIAQALVASPRLLILDEPTSGLDPISRRHTRDLLTQLKNDGVTVFLSSHVLSEIEDICDTVAIMKQGKLIACDSPDSIRSDAASIQITSEKLNQEQLDKLAFLQIQIEPHNQTTTLTISPDDLYRITDILHQIGAKVVEVNTIHETLEQAFLRLAA